MVIFGDYPPQHHMLRDLHISIEFQGKRRGTIRAPVVPEICADRGGVHLGVVATLVDLLGGGLAIKAIYPDWIATADLSVYTNKCVTSGNLEASGRIIRTGKTTVVMEADLFNDTGVSKQSIESIGTAMMTFSRLPRRDDTITLDENPTSTLVYAIEGSEPSRHFVEETGIDILDGAAGVVELKMSGYVRNRIRVLQGGAVALLIDVAGQHAARACTEKPVATSDLTIHYLSQGKVGPFRTRARVVRATSDTALTRIEVIDGGANNRLLAIGMNTATLPDGY